jgi:sialate O-acetylesterase
VRPNPLFSEGVVLQRERMIPVWGTADEGERVTVAIKG